VPSQIAAANTLTSAYLWLSVRSEHWHLRSIGASSLKDSCETTMMLLLQCLARLDKSSADSPLSPFDA